jgi:hypothetical protein
LASSSQNVVPVNDRAMRHHADMARERRLASGAIVALVLVAAAACGSSTPAGRKGTHEPVGGWRTVDEGKSDLASWTVYASAATSGGRCLSVAFVPLARDVSPPLPRPAGSAPGQFLACAPAPSLTDTQSQPLYTLAVEETGSARFHYAAGLAAPGISEIGVECDDGSRATVAVHEQTFVLVFPTGKRLAALRPAVAAFPNLTCTVVTEPPNGYRDGGCQRYRINIP